MTRDYSPSRSPSPNRTDQASTISIALNSFFYKMTTYENKIINSLGGIEDTIRKYK